MIRHVRLCSEERSGLRHDDTLPCDECRLAGCCHKPQCLGNIGEAQSETCKNAPA